MPVAQLKRCPVKHLHGNNDPCDAQEVQITIFYPPLPQDQPDNGKYQECGYCNLSLKLNSNQETEHAVGYDHNREKNPVYPSLRIFN